MLEVAYQETLLYTKAKRPFDYKAHPGKRSNRLIDCFTVNVQFSR